MSQTIERLKKAAVKEKSSWIDDAKWRQSNKTWLKKSSKIAVRVLREIRAQKPINGMTQKKLAEEMGVTPQYINKVVKGKENLTLETISKLEQVLGTTLMTVAIGQSSSAYVIESDYSTGSLNSLKSKPINHTKVNYQPECFISNTEDYGQTG